MESTFPVFCTLAAQAEFAAITALPELIMSDSDALQALARASDAKPQRRLKRRLLRMGSEGL
ncbi:hypothetical protein ASE76_16185 [Xylophilus sp. Leaf220]|nr:hypothetical protein ASE76_16185 [Xylophilus sp. Leaf220]